MNTPVVVIGMGEIGGVFARAFLRAGNPVYPVLRGDDPARCAARLPAPETVVLAVAESDLHKTLETIPDVWKDRLVLLQNELLPADWLRHGLDRPTVVSVWFEKKKGQDVKVLLPSPALGRHAPLLRDALGQLNIPARVLDTDDDLLYELVLKNLYILTTNIAGLKVGGTVGELWSRHNDLARTVARDVIGLQEALTGRRYSNERLIEGMLEAFHGDLEHRCTGRSAPARLRRALELAREYGCPVPALETIAQEEELPVGAG